MTQIVYSREAVDLSDGQVFQNPRFFTGPVAGVDSVVVHGDWPDIVAAYVVSGVPVTAIVPQAPPVAHEPAPGDFGPLAQAFAAEPAQDPQAVVQEIIDSEAWSAPTEPVLIGKARKSK